MIPQLPLGGIQKELQSVSCRLDLNHPLAAASGIGPLAKETGRLGS
jgi:hypothetical protein